MKTIIHNWIKIQFYWTCFVCFFSGVNANASHCHVWTYGCTKTTAADDVLLLLWTHENDEERQMNWNGISKIYIGSNGAVKNASNLFITFAPRNQKRIAETRNANNPKMRYGFSISFICSQWNVCCLYCCCCYFNFFHFILFRTIVEENESFPR